MQPKNTPPQNVLSPKEKRQLREAAKKLINEKYVLENGLLDLDNIWRRARIIATNTTLFSVTFSLSIEKAHLLIRQ